MTQAKIRFPSFEAYLAYSDAADLEGRYELIEGALVELPPEFELNNWLALNLRDYLVQFMNRRLVRVHVCEIQVPVLRPKDPANRFPDLVILRPEHLELTQRRLTITLDMPPPVLVMEIVSPGKTNQTRDYVHKRAQYAAIGVPEYWLVNPTEQTVIILQLEGESYREVGLFRAQEAIVSVSFPEVSLTAEQVLGAEAAIEG